MTEPPPLPVQQLNYSDPARDGASVILPAICLAGIAFGSLQLVYSAAQLAPAILSGSKGNIPFGLNLNVGRPLNILLLAIEAIEDAAAIALIIGAAGLRTLRTWATPTIFTALITFMAVYLIAWITRMFQMFGSGPFLQQWTPTITAIYLVSSAASMCRSLLLPAVMLWLLTRPGIRRLHGSFGSM